MKLDERLINEDIENLSKIELIRLVHDLKRTKDLQENFLLNISHDLRSPINVILSVLQCLKYEKESSDNVISSKRKEYRDIIRRNSLKIIKLIDNLIDSSKLEKNFYNLKRYNIEIIGLIESVVTSIEKYAKEKDISVIFDTNVEEFECAVDPAAMDRVVMNLLSNAIKFSPKHGKILVYVQVKDEVIEISVKDEGIGIPKEEQKDIFNRFVQSSQNKKNEYSGSGIGLDLVNYLVKAHGGNIKLESDLGCGSNFIVTLPITILDIEEKDYEVGRRSRVEQLEVEFSDIYL
ncbi:HAMP domain-containing sensor histidine kinase [uncultured Clostridium sp.]|uniref:sensor histidine kinase n=1 Tax=uncultured Clostridium sp. TaxID=59620 RepID=UPI0025E996B2|nr:HAMP domain-containing sensor histidine kinase [uncultured Clostridium sp.]